MDDAVSETQSEWLTEKQQRTWIGYRAVATLLDNALDRELQQDTGISHVTYVTLSMLSMAPDRTMSMTTLANVTNSSPSRMSHAVARLEERGWVTRAKAPNSGRLVNATLTESGMEIVVTAAPGHVAMVRKLMFERLTSQQVDELDRINSIILGSLIDHGFPILVPIPFAEGAPDILPIPERSC